jgi:two-component system sensor histidine kinase MtrB
MMGSFRTRLVVTILLLVVVTSAALAVGSFLLVRSSLRDQLVEDARDRAQFAVITLAEAQQLPASVDREAFEASGLADRILLRGADGVFVDFGDDDPYASSPEFLVTPQVVSPELVTNAEQGRYGYQFLDIGSAPLLVIAATRPGSDEVYYLFSDASVVGQAAGDLARYLGTTAVVVIVIAAAMARIVARGVLRPVDDAARAAEALAAGDLATRVPWESDDELGRMVASFNHMAASLQTQVDELERAEERERRFVADVSHELRTPLTGLWNEAQLLEGSIDELHGTGRRAAQLLIQDVARLRRLVEELLEISRLESSGLQIDLVRTDVRQLAEALVKDRLPTATVHGTVPVVTCDRAGIERVVANLLDNAAAHAPGAGVDVFLELNGDMLSIAVADDGSGVAADQLERLFDRF